ncbi:DUF333 domain-containing protein [Brenneria sp. 4F2]|nr:DUF333 domain-containing protein [Brenneria bubanii]
MKLAGVYIALTVVVGCSARAKDGPPEPIGMPNPASVYCQEQGGKSQRVEADKGTVSYCLLPGGERIEEWTLYRRDNKSNTP